MEHQPLISVVIPVWNGAKHIESCLRTVMSQSAADMEIIVVDDGSTDDTWAIISRLAAEDGRIRVIRQENAGVSEARNTALRQCRGRYVRFVDADDALPEGSMEMLVSSMEEQGSDIVFAAYTEVLAGIRSVRNLNGQAETIDRDAFMRRLERLSNSFYYGVLWNKLFRGDVIRDQALRFDPALSWGEDFCFVMDYLAHCQTYTYITEPVYDYIRNPQGAVIRQFFYCFRHPILSMKDRCKVYSAYRRLYQCCGLYDQYKRVLWHYLFRFTLRS
ncbi:MAG: glycosyltransferase family 2 protein [Clostridia bacterium]|nr:glycosyltransferase family 2 protein [Clostridia bacterium]